jgi:hypothetical protein
MARGRRPSSSHLIVRVDGGHGWWRISFGAGEMLVPEDQKLQCKLRQRLEHHVYKVWHMYAVLSSKKWSVLNVVEHGEVFLHRN